MYVKTKFPFMSFLNVILAGFLLSLVMSVRANVSYGDITAQSSLSDGIPDFTSLSIYEDDDCENADEQLHLDWSKVEVSIAMIRTSFAPHCWANCVGHVWRGSKVRLTFPQGFVARVRKELGAGVGKGWFLVKPESTIFQDRLKIYFDDFSHPEKIKATSDGRYFVERSSNYGLVDGERCSSLRTESGDTTPLSFILESVHFENTNASESVALYPNTKAEAVSSGDRYYSCAGPYVTLPVVPW